MCNFVDSIKIFCRLLILLLSYENSYNLSKSLTHLFFIDNRGKILVKLYIQAKIIKILDILL